MAEALAQAAHRQLTDELETATQVNFVSIVPVLVLPSHATLLMPACSCQCSGYAISLCQGLCQVQSCIQLKVACSKQCIEWCGAAVQEVKAVEAVQSELETFQAEMQQASLSQRQVGQAAVDAAVQRAQRFVDRTLRLTNLSTLSAYVLGNGPLPVSRSFQGEILGDATRQLTDTVSEHSTWLRDNCDRQVRNYR